METYMISLTSTGGLTQIPDSQKLFGALVYLFSDQYGKERANRFVKDVLDKKIYLALSNIMPEKYFPMPVEYLVDKLHDIDNEKRIDLSKYKSCLRDGKLDLKLGRSYIKQRNYIQYPGLKGLLEDPLKADATYPYVKIVEKQQQRASIESTQLGIAGLDSNLYSIPYLIPLEFDGEESQGRVITKFSFFLQADEDALNSGIYELVKGAVDEGQTIILGKRASQGLNVFQFTGLEKCDIDKNAENMFLNMGMLLPGNINYKGSTLKLFTSERRPFEMTGGWDSTFQRQYISFIEAGSVISILGDCIGASKSIESPFDSKSIVFGNAFLYPMPTVGEVKNG